MANIIINIDCDNNAFDGEMLHSEVARILRKLADQAEDGLNDCTKIRDVNGNRVGQMEFYA